jgi:hypothetical protein
MNDVPLGSDQAGMPVWGSDIVLDMLRLLEVEYAAVLPGASFRGIHDSAVNYTLNRQPELILCNHESTTVSLARGYAKVTRQAHGRHGAQRRRSAQRRQQFVDRDDAGVRIWTPLNRHMQRLRNPDVGRVGHITIHFEIAFYASLAAGLARGGHLQSRICHAHGR